METRREFLQMTLAVAALPAAAGTAVALAAGPIPQQRIKAPSLYKILYDERFAASAHFGAAARRAGWSAHSIRGDVTSVWFDDLNVRWKNSPVPIAGLTAPAALFCLERLAWDHGMRCVFHEEHPDSESLAWAQTAIDTVTRFPLDHVVATGPTQVGLPRSAGDHSPMLVSWVIAPVVRS